jgi:DNA-binding beta-propeller fold protein YncE
VFIGTAAAAGAAHTIAGRALSAAAEPGQRPCAPTPPGIRTGAIAATRDGRTVWTADVHATTITAHRGRDLLRGRSIDVGGAPRGIAIAPDGASALVTTASYDRPGLSIVDLRSGEVERLDVGPEPGQVAFTADGRSAYVVGGGTEGTLTRIDVRTGNVHTPVALGSHARGLAILRDGEHALVALNGDHAIAFVALTSGKVARRIATPPYPHDVAVSAGGTHALATHDGFGARRVTPIDVRRGRAGRQISVGADPGGVAFARSGALAIVAATGSGHVSLIDARSGRRRRAIAVGGAPRSVTVGGRRGFVADLLSGEVKAIRLGVVA